MPDYQKAKIYKLISLETNEFYIGSTVRSLSHRKGGHISSYKAWLLNKKSPVCHSYKLIEIGDVDIILIENYPCNNKEELHSRERFHIENNKCINIKLPIVTKKDIAERQKKYWQDNAEYFHKWRKQDKLDNPDKYKEKNKRAYEISKPKRFICECGSNVKLHGKNEHFQSDKHKNFFKD
jgi:hypothetical protein